MTPTTESLRAIKSLRVVPDGAWHKKANRSEGRDAEWAISLLVGTRETRYMLSVSGPSDRTAKRLLEWLGFDVGDTPND